MVQLRVVVFRAVVAIGLCSSIRALSTPGSRRTFIGSFLAATSIIFPRVASVAESSGISKPFAPMEALLPAIRVKRFIDKAISLADANDIDNLRDLLLGEQSFTDSPSSKPPQQPAKAYLEKYKRNRENLSIMQQPGAVLVQQGELMAWRNLKKRESKMSNQDPLRAALNAYTDKLEFSSSEYVLNVSKEARSLMIRQDKLPDVTEVVNSDMGVRYLYRNDLLTSMADARAEFSYQLSHEKDLSEVRELLINANTALSSWLHLIDKQEVEAALRAVDAEWIEN